MIKRGKHIIKNYMTLKYNFTGIRLHEGYLGPVDWELTVDLIVPDRKNKEKNELEQKAGISYQKLYFWLDTNLPNIIVIDVNKETDLYIANLSSNIMMYCPEAPSDDLIIQLLHSKLSALSGAELIIGEMKLKSSDSTLQYAFDSQDSEYLLPNKTSEYYKEGVARDVTPWWARDDGFCFEFIRPADVEITDEELFKDICDPLSEFYRIMEESSEENIGAIKEPARIVQVEKWKPRKVE
jgi:hypothetical protein